MLATFPTNAVQIPRDMAVKEVAECFTAYLLASGSFGNLDLRRGPFWLDHSNKWQLDGSNDYWLRETGEREVTVTCRYDGQQPVVSAMLDLFRARFR